jgi:N-acetylglutamate synthase-like GNAT family acetyltransferase
MNQIEVHTYSDLYKEEIGHLIVGIQQEEFNIPITLADQPDLNNIRDFYQVGHGNFWVATVDGKIAGTIALLDIGNGQGALRKMFVHEKYRGKELGIGKTLLNTLLQWVKDKRFLEVFLGTTEKFIAAQRFYEKNSFKEISKDQLPKEFPIMKVDVKFYVYTVNPINIL